MSKQNEEPDLNTLMKQFDEIVAWFDQEELDVEAALKKFEEGNKLAEEIRKRLETLENRITVLKQSVSEE